MVSVIVPVYNLEDCLAYCLDSLVKQTYRNIEIIVINDGSTDNSKSIIGDFYKRDPRIKPIEIENGGVSNARNVGLDSSKGEFIAFVDGDDIVSEDYIEFLINQMSEDSVLSMCTSETLVKPQTQFKCERREGHKYLSLSCAEWLLNGRFYNRVWGALFRRDAIGEIRFLKGVNNTEDTMFLFNFLINNEKRSVVFSDSALYGYLNRPNSATKTLKLESMEGIILVSDELYRLVISSHPEWLEVAKQNRLASRFNVLKSIIRSNCKDNEHREVYNRVRNEILCMGLPSRSYGRLKVEYTVISISNYLYSALVKSYYYLVDENRRHSFNEKKRIKL